MDERPDGYRVSAAPTPFRWSWWRRALRRVRRAALWYRRPRGACEECGRVRPLSALRLADTDFVCDDGCA